VLDELVQDINADKLLDEGVIDDEVGALTNDHVKFELDPWKFRDKLVVVLPQITVSEKDRALLEV
jgi:hypothetical protein